MTLTTRTVMIISRSNLEACFQRPAPIRHYIVYEFLCKIHNQRQMTIVMLQPTTPNARYKETKRPACEHKNSSKQTRTNRLQASPASTPISPTMIKRLSPNSTCHPMARHAVTPSSMPWTQTLFPQPHAPHYQDALDHRRGNRAWPQASSAVRVCA
jgi:hypothetical protein